MRKGGLGDEEVLNGTLLFFRRALGQGLDDGPDFLNYGGRKKPVSVARFLKGGGYDAT